MIRVVIPRVEMDCVKKKTTRRKYVNSDFDIENGMHVFVSANVALGIKYAQFCLQLCQLEQQRRLSAIIMVTYMFQIKVEKRIEKRPPNHIFDVMYKMHFRFSFLTRRIYP